MTEKEIIPVSENNVSLSGLEQYLLDTGVLSGTRTETTAEMIGAVSGFKYAGAEIHEFDENSEDDKKMTETNTITLEDFGISLISRCNQWKIRTDIFKRGRSGSGCH